MAELDFEMKLDRMFNEPPGFEDSHAFAKLVEMRLDRGWNLRQIVMGATGVIVGLIGVFQLIGSRFLFEAGAEAGQQMQVFSGLFRQVEVAGDAVSMLPFGGQAIWMAAGLGVMALAFAVARTVEELK